MHPSVMADSNKTEERRTYSSTMESNGALGSSSSSSVGGAGGDLTARNHSRHHENENENADDAPHHLQISNGSEHAQRQSGLVTWSSYILLGGTVLGLALPKNQSIPSRTWQVLSNVVGYTYFLAWSASFYPQIFLNHRRRTTRGLSVDFCVLNVLGYCCYTTYTTNFYWNENVIREYKERMSRGTEQGEITVQANDVAFAVHAVLMASVTLSQIGIYDTFAVRPPSARVYVILASTLAFCIMYVTWTWLYQGQVDFLGFLYLLGTIKIGVTIGKYVPQALLNRARKSTVGWNVFNVILDLTGGVLSLLQLVGDCAAMNDWTGITGNPAKIALSLVTICFDLIFLVQHYILYPDLDDRPFYSPLPAIESTGVKK